MDAVQVKTMYFNCIFHLLIFSFESIISVVRWSAVFHGSSVGLSLGLRLLFCAL